MQPFPVFLLVILILLATTLTQAQIPSKPRCDTSCGVVYVTYPFGIGRNCSANEWYTVDCNSSTPYLSALNNMEVLRIDGMSVTVNMPVIKADCKNPVKNINLFQNISSHGKNPFLFSREGNVLVFKGCGSAAIMENGSTETTVVSGCSTTCSNNGGSTNCFGNGCCQSTIHRDLTSFTFDLTKSSELQNGDGSSCESAFLVAEDYVGSLPTQYSSGKVDHAFFPISLWSNETINLDSRISCKETCGEIPIPYPFGIGRNCSESDLYNVDCNSSTPYLPAFNSLQVLGFNSEYKTVTVNLPMIYDCENPIQNASLNDIIGESPFRLSGSDNIFVVEGCGSASIIQNETTVVSGCSTTCGSDTDSDIYNCYGVGCCQTAIPYDLQSFTFNLRGLQRRDRNGTCRSAAFVVDRNLFTKRRFSRQFVPVTLGWVENYRIYPIQVVCPWCELHGGNCEGSDNGVTGTMKCLYESRKDSHIVVIRGVGISMGSLLFTIICYVLYNIDNGNVARRKKEGYFKRNGGLLLKQQQATDTSLVDKTILFTSNELAKATDNFNDNRILGRGAQGTVYKGMLADGRIVAIKKSKVVDESQLEQFINEVVILSQVNHRNVVKLLGCCLETDVPLLVSEFISNGTLYDFIHDDANEFSVSLNMRLQIATEVAGALSYLHSSTSIPIYHRDIKTTNILLDEKYRAKVSDFGTSRFVAIDQTHLTTLVKGTFGYLDPEYFQTSQFTEKSDVYSFGVVLLELLTREKPISLTRFGENRSLVTHFMEAMEEGRVMSIFDEMIVKEGSRSGLLSIANLALQCLNLNGKDRPTMKEVSIELEGMRMSHVPSTVQTGYGYVSFREELPQIYGGSTSTSLTFDDDLCR